MTEFGHTASIGPNFCIDTWGVGPFVINVGGKQYRFEDSDRFGPYILRKDGSIAERQPGEKNHFWDGHLPWVRQGRRTKGDGITCVYDPLRLTTYYLVGREMKIIEEGDEYGGYQVMPRPPINKQSDER